jgi:hypothetical protein
VKYDSFLLSNSGNRRKRKKDLIDAEQSCNLFIINVNIITALPFARISLAMQITQKVMDY